MLSALFSAVIGLCFNGMVGVVSEIPLFLLLGIHNLNHNLQEVMAAALLSAVLLSMPVILDMVFCH
jgi:hypothetical protein